MKSQKLTLRTVHHIFPRITFNDLGYFQYCLSVSVTLVSTDLIFSSIVVTIVAVVVVVIKTAAACLGWFSPCRFPGRSSNMSSTVGIWTCRYVGSQKIKIKIKIV